jgi:aminoglycoside/choline kinase family phosphotransferase
MSVNRNLSELVNIDGELDATRISSMEAIYGARSGKQVQRFIFQGVSYIFKPCTINTSRRELWVQQNLLPFIEGLRVPCILASGDVQQSTNNWMIYEDLGSLVHLSRVDEIVRAAGIIPFWHRVAVTAVPSDVKGHSPSYTEVIEQLLLKKQLVNTMLEQSRIDRYEISNWWTLIVQWASFINNNQVVSHGDYYRLNIALRNHENIVLDWEFAHVNSVYWDIYSLMDITSYRYTHVDLDKKDRDAALRQYWMSKNDVGLTMPYDDFVKGYHVFASVYSVWILTLIVADLQHSSEATEALIRQRHQTESVLMQNLERLSKH